jgi:hypothetical protein
VTRRDKASPPDQPSAITVYYAEDHCALRWPLVTTGLYAPLLALAVVVTAFATQETVLYWPSFAFLGLGFVAWSSSRERLSYVWPTGIRLDSAGVRIGGVRWAERHPGRTHRRKVKATVPWQCAQVFACPWEGVVGLGVTTSRDLTREAIRRAYHGRKPTPLGNLSAPFMRAALVIVVRREHARVPGIGPARGPLFVNWSSPGYHQPVWIVPTRHPGQLKAALAAMPLPAGVIRDDFGEKDIPAIVPGWVTGAT